MSMGLFEKKQEQFEKKQEQFEILKHVFDENEIAYRYPKEDFLSGSVLFVQPGQEAVLIKEGDQDGPYTNGRYTLNTNELPGISKFINKTYGGNKAFNCYLYFINKAKPVTVYWGTPHHLMVRDGETGREVRMMANGNMAFAISNSLQFIERMNGQMDAFTSEEIGDFLFEKFIERISSMISGAFDELEQSGMPVKRIQGQAAAISDRIKERAIAERLFETYGLALEEFSIYEIKMHAEDEEELRKEQNELARRKREADIKFYETKTQGAAEAAVVRAKGQAESDVMKEKGEYYSKERMYDVLQTAATNESGISGTSFIGAGVGLGMGLGVGGGIGGVMGNMMAGAISENKTQPAQTEKTGEPCPDCNTVNAPGAKFCSGCGKKLGPKTVKCPSCSAENPVGAKFCSECGTSLLPKKIKCPSCGTELDQGAKFCPECGAKITQ